MVQDPMGFKTLIITLMVAKASFSILVAKGTCRFMSWRLNTILDGRETFFGSYDLKLSIKDTMRRA